MKIHDLAIVIRSQESIRTVNLPYFIKIAAIDVGCYGCKFIKKIPNFAHNLGGRLTTGCGYWIRKENLALIYEQ